MGKKGISEKMTIHNIIDEMSEGNPGAMEAIIELMQDSNNWLSYMKTFDDLEIYGSKIYMIWNDSCKRNIDKYKETVKAFQEGRFTKEEIQKNLSQGYATPFINEESEEVM